MISKGYTDQDWILIRFYDEERLFMIHVLHIFCNTLGTHIIPDIENINCTTCGTKFPDYIKY